ncbi:MAG: hypothetical protein CL760_00915 [Chloroflexi bacterium]|nr:hypothetical protein [Chloroflexota bacterium]|tara:strand:+ start:36720 stop:37259 length:540 start_codon:yes stop_codon:yes gene_type:complete
MYGLKLYLDWEDGLKKNKKMLLKERMWEQSFGTNSTFYKYFIGERYVKKGTTILAYDDGLLAGVLIFPHLESMTGSIEVLKSVVNYKSIGEVQIYIKPEYRKQGIARKLVERLNKELTERYKEDFGKKTLIVQAVQNAYPIAARFMTNFVTAHSYEDDKEELEEFLIRNQELLKSKKTA